MKKNVGVGAFGVLIGALIVSVISSGFTNGVSFGASAISSVDDQSGDKLVALSTFTILADMVREVGGDKVESISLTKPGAEIHGYETTPGDLVQASRAHIFFENGLNLELWAKKLRASLPDMPSVIVSEGVEVREIKEGSYEGKPNPHAWMSPKQGMIYIENIRKALAEVDPDNADYYNANAAAYIAKLEAVDTGLRESLATLPENNRYLVTCEGAFAYLATDYDLHEVYLWAINDESGGSPQDVARVIDLVRENNIPAVFCESTVAPKIQQEVINATGARLGGTLYVDSLSLADGPAPTYLKLLESSAEIIIGGLTK
ncbi:zinc ABC transporter substrate-binding protein [Candidatus Nomurabacteria bacterium]|nr:zinc ABC transporter substrate-binding protein [Candidatus Kaiserbacteria bacterium]MCB9815325.1 zinc ABC transporter substrate-binding protein [Candidatus Nomurabacteria bacterium]MCB9819548.1 zinc ABC transporter substrate-binding protein [Candidatus Nomurabacteria bacterium]